MTDECGANFTYDNAYDSDYEKIMNQTKKNKFNKKYKALHKKILICLDTI